MAYIYDDSQTYTGEIVNFTSTDKAKITSVSVPITPTQDLHGYATPWPGGGGKNKIDKSTGLVYSTRYMVFGVANPSDTIPDGSFVLPAGDYTFSLSGDNSTNAESMSVFGADGTRIKIVYNNKVLKFTNPSSQALKLAMAISSQNFQSWDNYDMQMESGSTATAWEPYANICPISGLTGLSVYRTGKNLFDEVWERGAISTTTGESVSSNTSIRTANYIPLVGGQSYYWSWQSQQSLYMLLFTYHADKTFSRYVGAVTAQRTITLNSDEAFIRFYIYNNTTEPDWMQISEGSTASQYEPYNGNTYAVDWSTQAGTVYHGTVDPVAGQLTVDRAYKSFDGSSTTGIGVYNPLSGFWFALPGMSANYSADGLCNMDKTRTAYGTGGVIFGIGNNNYAYFTNLQTISGVSTVDDLCSWLQSNNIVIEFVYPLATPLTYQLTPKQIAALTENYVLASNGASITVVVSDILHDFQGWLLKVGSGMTLVPTEMIKAETYKVSPNQRMEETAERDSTGVLWRETVPNMPPKIEFNTPAAYDTDVNALNAIFRAAYSNEQERKLTVAFYDPEENVYKSWVCYMPNIDFPIRTIDIDAKTIFYDEIRYAFIGY